MSTFKGLFEEEAMKYIAADYFEPEVHHCDAFFLSHCHTDHMRGLNSTFSQLLKDNPEKKMFCSLITKELFTQLPNSKPFNLETIIVLDIYKPHLLEIHGEYISVTLLPAGHCPGSVMYLFESSRNGGTCVLFTGDFRYDMDDMDKLRHLKNEDGSYKTIHNLYLDTTFALEPYKEFPSRVQSTQAILNVVEQYLKEDVNNKIFLDSPGRFGYEYVYTSIYQNLKIKIHLPDVRLKQYQNIPEIFECLTSDPKTRVHACSNISCLGTPSTSGELNHNVSTIKLSTMKFDEDFVEVIKGGMYKKSLTLYHIFFSTHCSLNELKTFVQTISPVKVTPFVIHPEYHISKEVVAQRVCEPITTKRNFEDRDIPSTPQKKAKLEFDANKIQSFSNSSFKIVDADKDPDLLKYYLAANTKVPFHIESPPGSPTI